MSSENTDNRWEEFDLVDSSPCNDRIFELTDEELKIAKEQAKSIIFLEKLCKELNILVELCETIKTETTKYPPEEWSSLSKILISVSNNCMGNIADAMATIELDENSVLFLYLEGIKEEIKLVSDSNKLKSERYVLITRALANLALATQNLIKTTVNIADLEETVLQSSGISPIDYEDLEEHITLISCKKTDQEQLNKSKKIISSKLKNSKKHIRKKLEQFFKGNLSLYFLTKEREYFNEMNKKNLFG